MSFQYMEFLQNLIDALTDLSIDIEGEDECIIASFRLELEDLKELSSDVKGIVSLIEEFESDWLNDIEDRTVRKDVAEVLSCYKK